MANPDVLFKGIIRAPGRGYTADVMRDLQPGKVVIPCTGTFSLAGSVVGAGVPPECLVCGDVSLYSAVIGHAINQTDFRLDVRPESEYAELVAPHMGDPVTRAAAVLLMIRVLQHTPMGNRRKGIYYTHRRNELLRRFPEYIEQLCESLYDAGMLLQGMTYVSQDMQITIDQHIGSPGTVLLIDPPWYKGGYERMFEGIDTVFDWDEPPITELTKDSYPQFMQKLAESESLSLLYYASNGTDPAKDWGRPWRAVFAEQVSPKGTSAVHWIVANRSIENVQISRAKATDLHAQFKIFEGEIRDDASIWATRITRDIGDYYRDLWIHRLPGSTAETYLAVLIDGDIFAVIGLNLSDLYHGKDVRNPDGYLTTRYAFIQFAFNAPHDDYLRLQQLVLKITTASWFWEDYAAGDNWMTINGIPDHVRTAMLLRYPKSKAMRGIMTLRSSKPTKDGTYHLMYDAPVEPQSRKDTLSWWIKKYSNAKKSNSSSTESAP